MKVLRSGPACQDLSWCGPVLALWLHQQAATLSKLHMHCGAGQEWKFDSYTLPPEAKNRTVLTGLVSPEPNSYTQSPAEYKPYYEAMAFAWLFSQAVGGCLPVT